MINPSDCMETINSIKHDYDYMENHFENRSPMSLWYEDLNENFSQAIERTQDYANLTRQTLTAKLKKQGNSELKDTIENYGEVIDFLNENNCHWLLS